MQRTEIDSAQNKNQLYSQLLFDDLFSEQELPRQKSQQKAAPKQSKKEYILSLHTSGITDVLELSQHARTTPSYVANVLQNAGRLQGYNDLYTTTGNDQNIYSRFFRNVLSFKSPEAARESVERIDGLYRYFEKIGDRAGQHHAQVLALTGRNRARWSGKHEEARIFTEWLLKT
jgi:hypothetical protein